MHYNLLLVSTAGSRQTKVAAATVSHEKEKRQPKYIGNLLKQAKMRAVESDRIFERKLQKEREEQDKVTVVSCLVYLTHRNLSFSTIPNIMHVYANKRRLRHPEDALKQTSRVSLSENVRKTKRGMESCWCAST